MEGTPSSDAGAAASTDSHFGSEKAAGVGRRDAAEGFRCPSLPALCLCPRSLSCREPLRLPPGVSAHLRPRTGSARSLAGERGGNGARGRIERGGGEFLFELNRPALHHGATCSARRLSPRVHSPPCSSMEYYCRFFVTPFTPGSHQSHTHTEGLRNTNRNNKCCPMGRGGYNERSKCSSSSRVEQRGKPTTAITKNKQN